MVENHFCVGFIEPFCQSLQSNQKISARRFFLVNENSFNYELRIVYPVNVP